MPKRMFIAIDLPKQVAWQLGQLVQLRQHGDEPPRGVRPVRPAQLHLTLHFLGDVEDDSRLEVREQLAAVRHEPFTITIKGTGVFPPRGRPSVLWAGVVESQPLAELHAAVAAAIESCGLPVEHRPYVPHVTLARLSPAVPRAWTARFLADTAGLAMADIPAERFQLYESRKLDGASEHLVEATYSLD